jgi:hypothetical protein
MAFVSPEAVAQEICDRILKDVGCKFGEYCCQGLSKYKTDFTKMISNLVGYDRQNVIEVLSESIRMLEQLKNYAVTSLDESSILVIDTQLITMQMALELVRLAYRGT